MSVQTESGIIHVYATLHYSMLVLLAGSGMGLAALMIELGADTTIVAVTGALIAVFGLIGGIIGTVVGEKELKNHGFWEEETQ